MATGLIASHFGPVIGGLFLAFPAIFPASATPVEKAQEDAKHRVGIAHTTRGRLSAALDARGASMGAIALVGFATVVWRALPAHDAALTLGGALALWLILAVSIWRVRRLHVYLRRKRP